MIEAVTVLVIRLTACPAAEMVPVKVGAVMATGPVDVKPDPPKETALAVRFVCPPEIAPVLVIVPDVQTMLPPERLIEPLLMIRPEAPLERVSGPGPVIDPFMEIVLPMPVIVVAPVTL